MIVLDTHAWIWWISNPELLPRRTLSWIEKAINKNAVFISTISVWEVALLVEKKRLKLTMSIQDWILQNETLPYFQFIPVDNAVILQSIDLPGFLYKDPADRIIMATAILTNSFLITKDERIRNYSRIKTVWK